MTPLQCETTIKTILETAITNRKIELYPNRPEDYELLHPNGAVLINYLESSYQREDINHLFVAQNRDAYVQIYVLNRNLLSSSGVKGDIQNVIAALQGYNISSYNENRPGRIWVRSDKFYSYDESQGVWTYEIIVGIPTEQNQSSSLI